MTKTKKSTNRRPQTPKAYSKKKPFRETNKGMQKGSSDYRRRGKYNDWSE